MGQKLVVLAKTISEQTGETVAPSEQPEAEEVPVEVVE